MSSYVVACSQWSINGTVGLGVKIQSTRAPWYTESRVDAFFEKMSERIAAMPADEFATQKEGLIVKTLERAKNLGEETVRFWGHIRSGYYDFVKRMCTYLLRVPPGVYCELTTRCAYCRRDGR